MNLLLEVPGVTRSRFILLATAIVAAALWLPVDRYVESLMQSRLNSGPAATQPKPNQPGTWDLRSMWN